MLVQMFRSMRDEVREINMYKVNRIKIKIKKGEEGGPKKL